MQIISPIEERFKQRGLINDYTAKVADNSETVTVAILANGLQTINLAQNSFLDSKNIKAVEFISADQLSYSFASDGTQRENIAEANLPEFLFKLKKDTTEIFIVPASVTNTKLNSGKFYQCDSVAGNHCIGDSEVLQISAGSYSGYLLTIRFWYNN